MDLRHKVTQVSSFLRLSNRPLYLIMDLLRLKTTNYRADSKGLKFDLQAGCFEWFTLYENIIREDYIKNGIELNTGDTIVDIGANFGAFAAFASRRAGPIGRVFAFEPNAVIYNRLTENIALNGLTNVTTFNEAIGAQEGELKFFIHRKSAFTTMMESVDSRGNEGSDEVIVKCRPLAAILADIGSTIDLLKIDCEGAEYLILESLDPVVARHIKQITMEVHVVPGRHYSEIPLMLERLGFRVEGTFPHFTAFRGDKRSELHPVPKTPS